MGHDTGLNTKESTLESVIDIQRFIRLLCYSMEKGKFSFDEEGSRKFIAKQLLKDKKFWFASVLIVWAAGLQGHMMWLQRQDSFKQKFGNPNDEGTHQHERADNHN